MAVLILLGPTMVWVSSSSVTVSSFSVTKIIYSIWQERRITRNWLQGLIAGMLQNILGGFRCVPMVSRAFQEVSWTFQGVSMGFRGVTGSSKEFSAGVGDVPGRFREVSVVFWSISWVFKRVSCDLWRLQEFSGGFRWVLLKPAKTHWNPFEVQSETLLKRLKPTGTH